MNFTVLTKPHQRMTGREKVTGQAQYAGDVTPSGALHAHLVTATISVGRIIEIDTAEAKAVPGVRLVMTHRNTPDYKDIKSFYSGGLGQSSWWPMKSPEIRYAGQIVAFVVAETLEAAREAAAKVAVTYEEQPSSAVFATAEAEPREVEPLAKSVGDAEAALESAAHVVRGAWHTPVQHHNPMEMFWTTAEWRGDNLTVWVPTQGVTTTKMALAEQLGVAPGRIEVVCPLVGGAFGSKGTHPPYATLTALAAREVGRPVKLMVTRKQMYTVASYRPAARQEMALGCDAEGRITSFVHDAYQQTSRFDDVVNPGTEMTTRMYGFPALKAREFVTPTDLNTPGFMRAPNEVPAYFALETAIDELAEKAGMDPVAFRILNDTQNDPVTGVPFSSRSMVECFRKGAETFGWGDRSWTIGEKSTTDELVGWGCALSTYPTLVSPSSARIRLEPSGQALVEVACHDVGTGATTLMALIAAERLGLDPARVTPRIGHSSLPVGPISGGSTTSASSGSAVWLACDRVRATLAKAVTEGDTPLRNTDPASLVFANGEIHSGDVSMPLADAIAATGTGRVEESADYAHPDLAPQKRQLVYKGGYGAAGPVTENHAMFAFGAQFAEVRINPRTRSIRVPRIVGAFAAGNILNAMAARSQLMGGMVFGVGSVLHEATEIDSRFGRFTNDNIAEYLIPVNADIVEMQIETIAEQDDYVNPLGVKGIGELGTVGTAGAIANAVYHATGVRVRSMPIRIEDLLREAG